jgi:hypothetical protein
MKKNFFDCCNAASISLRLSQGSDYGAGMKFNLNEDGSKYLRDILGTDMDKYSDRPLNGNGNETS